MSLLGRRKGIMLVTIYVYIVSRRGMAHVGVQERGVLILRERSSQEPASLGRITTSPLARERKRVIKLELRSFPASGSSVLPFHSLPCRT